HLDQLDEAVAERPHGSAVRRRQIAEEGAGGDADQDLKIEASVDWRSSQSVSRGASAHESSGIWSIGAAPEARCRNMSQRVSGPPRLAGARALKPPPARNQKLKRSCSCITRAAPVPVMRPKSEAVMFVWTAA